MSSGPLEAVAGAVAAGKIDHAAENNNQGGFFLSSPAPLLASANAIRLIDDASAELKIRISSTNSLCSMDSNYTDVSVSPGVSPTLEPSPPLEPRSVSYEARLSMIDEAESKPMKLGCYDSSDEEELEKLEGASIICGSEVLPSTLSHGSIREPLHNLAPKPQHDQVPKASFFVANADAVRLFDAASKTVSQTCQRLAVPKPQRDQVPSCLLANTGAVRLFDAASESVSQSCRGLLMKLFDFTRRIPQLRPMVVIYLAQLVLQFVHWYCSKKKLIPRYLRV